MTNNICYVTAAAPVTCTRKKRRAVISDILETPRTGLEISPATLESHADAIDSSFNLKLDKFESSEREARLMSGLHYRITTTTTSTTTGVATIVQGTLVQVDCSPRRLLSKKQSSKGLLFKETFVQGDFSPRRLLSMCP